MQIPALCAGKNEHNRHNRHNRKRIKSTKEVGEDAASRTLMRLNPQKIDTGIYPVIFEAPIATSIISALVSAVSGGNLYRENSFLMNSINTQVASAAITIEEDPFLLRGNASTYFDDEGVAVNKRTVVDKGVMLGYFLSSYSARRLNMETTGNAGGRLAKFVLDINNRSFLQEKLDSLKSTSERRSM